MCMVRAHGVPRCRALDGAKLKRKSVTKSLFYTKDRSLPKSLLVFFAHNATGLEFGYLDPGRALVISFGPKVP